MEREFTSLEEAFGALSAPMQEHSRRVEQYADLLFVELCASEEYLGNIRSRVRLKPELRELVGMAARYHDVGKVLVPDFYQWDSPRYSAEEQALYRKHCLAGEELVRQKLEDCKGITPTTVEVLVESIGCHHERWDGTGFPRQTGQEDTPVIGRILAVANELDHQLMQTRSENPVQDVLDKMMEGSGTRFDPIIMGLMYDARRNLEKIFSRYQGQSQAIPAAPRIIRRKARRPMWLEYRPISRLDDRGTVALEARMAFRRGKETVDYAQVEHLLRESKNTHQVGMAFVLEACDMFRRMQTCKVGGEFVALNCVEGFLRKRGAATAIAKLLSDTDSDPVGLCFILRPEDATAPSAALLENCGKLRSLGCKLMLSGVDLSEVSNETLASLQLTHMRLTAKDSREPDKLTARLRAIAARGVELLAEDVNVHRLADPLAERCVKYGTGDLLGEYTTEDLLISGELALMES